MQVAALTCNPDTLQRCDNSETFKLNFFIFLLFHNKVAWNPGAVCAVAEGASDRHMGAVAEGGLLSAISRT